MAAVSRHEYLLLPSPSHNRVYAGAATQLAAAEAAILLGGGALEIEPVVVAGVPHLRLTSGTPVAAEAMAGLSSALMIFEEVGDGLLRPLPLPRRDLLDEDLLTIPKYRGKTNEQFTRLLVSLALAARETALPARRLEILDPMCGRGTTLSAAWLTGADAYGVDADAAAIEAHATFLKTYLRRKRLKHTVEVTPLRREKKVLGKRLAATVTLPDVAPLQAQVLTGDTRDSLSLWGKRRFDAVVTDAPYGVVHGSRTGAPGRDRERSAAGLLGEAVPVWAGQLRPGGVLAIAWNTLGLPREGLLEVMSDAGLRVLDDGPWRGLAHQVDSSIRRDIAVGVAPAP